jgi:hypothetical protein
VLQTEQEYQWPIIPRRPNSGATKMNLPIQSRPVIRDVSRYPAVFGAVVPQDYCSDCCAGCAKVQGFVRDICCVGCGAVGCNYQACRAGSC